MGIVAALGGHAYFNFLRKGSSDDRRRGMIIKSAFVAAWVSVVTASVAASMEIAFSGASPLATILPDMVLSHILIGLMEGCITAGALVYLLRSQYPITLSATENVYE